MDRAGWPAIPLDGKVQAPHGYADHVVLEHPEICRSCGARVCIESCELNIINTRKCESTVLTGREKPVGRSPDTGVSG